MPTTGGALAFAGFVPPYEATLTTNLRDAGAIIIAKTGMTELANWVAGAPTPMPANYNAVGGFGLNPYDPRRDPRPPTFDGRPALATGGSSSGIGTAASFWAANVGTETSGSILSPSNQNMLVGIKPTVGRISRYGVIPITADQDTPGPMAKSVTDAAILLGALEGAAPDPNDPATQPLPRRRPAATTRDSCERDGLKGARIGIPRAFFYDARSTARRDGAARRADRRPGGGDGRRHRGSQARRAPSSSILPTSRASSTPIRANNFLALEHRVLAPNNARGSDADCSIVVQVRHEARFQQLARHAGRRAPVKSLTELRQWNDVHRSAGAIKYGQARLDISTKSISGEDRAGTRLIGLETSE